MEKPLGEHPGDWLEAGVLDRAQVERIIAFDLLAVKGRGKFELLPF